MRDLWTVSPEWQGETAFIVAGGPSVADQDTDRLRGRKVIAINSSWRHVPFADVLFFGDSRWWNENKSAVRIDFHGIVATCAGSVNHPQVRQLRKSLAPGLAVDRHTVMMRRTSLTAAINLAVHLGVARIVLLGADGKIAADGRTHHHAPHPWDQRTGCWDEQRVDLAALVQSLWTRSIEVINASPGSALADLWPVMSLDEACRLAIPPTASKL